MVKSTHGIEYFSEVEIASTAKDCSTKPEPNWKVESFKAEGLEFQLLAPLGVVCGRNAAGTLVKTYRSTLVGKSTHRILYGYDFGIIETVTLERRDGTGGWTKVD